MPQTLAHVAGGAVVNGVQRRLKPARYSQAWDRETRLRDLARAGGVTGSGSAVRLRGAMERIDVLGERNACEWTARVFS